MKDLTADLDKNEIVTGAKIVDVCQDWDAFTPTEAYFIIEKDGQRYWLCGTELGWWLETISPQRR